MYVVRGECLSFKHAYVLIHTDLLDGFEVQDLGECFGLVS